MKTVYKIIKYDLCLGCGLCEAILGKAKCKMQLNDNGFYTPQFIGDIPKQSARHIKNCCPAIKVKNKNKTGIWGQVLEITEGWSNNEEIRYKGSSGGVITSLAIHLLETKKINAILQIGITEKSYLYNELKISKSSNEVIANSASRYAPALTFNRIKNIFDANNDKYALIGKPCDIAGIKNFLSEFPEYKKKVVYTIGLFCAGMPSYNATKKILSIAKIDEEPISIKYRGNGWPGSFVAKYAKENDFNISYNDSWGKILGKNLNFRCKICPDGIGTNADIAVGDSWDTKDGYPNFEESDGRSFVMIRTEKGREIYSSAVRENLITENKLNIERIKEIQPYQYQRKLLVGFRIIPVQIFTGFILHFNRLGIWKFMFKANFKSGIRNMLGTIKRILSK